MTMRYTKLGATGLDVSQLCLGCMSFGVPDRGGMPWTLDEADSRPIFRQAVEAGINFFDTANIYSDGTSEEITGRLLREFTDRDQVVVATKVHGTVRPGPNGGGLSRKAVMTQVDASLRRLGLDHIDLYQIHRWDDATPIEETLAALHDVVRAGKVRYLGASTMYAWQFSKAQYVAERHGWTRFASMQSQYNLLYREEEREMFPLCGDLQVGLIPWSPLARGRLTRDWDKTTARGETDARSRSLYRDGDRRIVEQVTQVAQARGVSRAQIALAWVLGRPRIDSAIVGATSTHHLREALDTLELALTPQEREQLEAPYEPRAFVS